MLPTYGCSIDGAHPHIEVDGRGMHFVVVERGQELERKTTSDPNELAFWVFQSVTFDMAVAFELRNREEGKDNRRMMFAKQRELMELIDSTWRKRLEMYHEQVLKKYPFDDSAVARARHCKELRDSGTNSEKAWVLACAKYPLPEEKQN